MSDPNVRPQTPQALLHRLPDKPNPETWDKPPAKFIVVITGSMVPGKLQIAQSVSKALACPLYQGDSLHESSAKAAGVGVSAGTDEETGFNETRYRRMWLAKMMRTGLLFPDESRPAGEGFSGFRGSTSTSRRGSASSVASSSDAGTSSSSVASDAPRAPPAGRYVNRPPPTVVTVSERERLRRANPALMVLTHPELGSRYKRAIRDAVGEYSIGVIFVPLYDDDGDLPVLRPLDPRSMTSFGDGPGRTAVGVEDLIVVCVDVEAGVEGVVGGILGGVWDVIGS